MLIIPCFSQVGCKKRGKSIILGVSKLQKGAVSSDTPNVNPVKAPGLRYTTPLTREQNDITIRRFGGNICPTLRRLAPDVCERLVHVCFLILPRPKRRWNYANS